MRLVAAHLSQPRWVGPLAATTAAAAARRTSPPMAFLLSRLSSCMAPHAAASVDAGAGDSSRGRVTTSQSSQPTHLYFCVHGLAGRPEDLSALRECLTAGGAGAALVHLAQANAYSRFATYDGVHAGAARLATELCSVVEAHPSVTHLSLVGNSLGGLYCRYLASLLYDETKSKIAGLQPVTFLTTASPHLGVGQHGHLRAIPRALQTVGGVVLGKSIKQLLLADGGQPGEMPLLLRMGTEEPFLAPLRAFRSRHLYANAINDLLVAYETAAIALEGLPSRKALLAAGPRKGKPRVLFTQTRPPLDATAPLAGSAAAPQHSVRAWQAAMARGLATMSWTETTVAFPGLLPLAHNRIVALRRDPLLTWVNACGSAVVEHTAATLLSDARGVWEASPATDGEGQPAMAAARM